MNIIVFTQFIKMIEKKIRIVKTLLVPKSVKDIQVFLDFANFYRRLINNCNKIVIPLIRILQTIDTKVLNTEANYNEIHQDILSGIGNDSSIGNNNKSIKNPLIIINLLKSKKSDLTNSKKSNLSKYFINNTFGIDFLTPRAKKADIHL